ncbi:MAG TPA: NAD+ synthase [Candidatus Polarisedimenticolia bacterium]|nr:NAD+ synthase [Candidatus Polarisedimenticolia bacterium]
MDLDLAGTQRVLTSFIAGEVLRTGRKRVVVGLSGGIDSAVAAVLARRALGASGVVAVLMPYRTSHPSSERDARRLTRALGVATERFDISPMVDAYFASDPRAGRVRRGNKMARERMSILYDRSEVHHALVLGTSNKTELLLGYGTLHGDMASALNPLGDLYKTQVRRLAERLRVPAAIRAKVPSADLWAGQTDEAELGHSYDELDRLLHLLVDRRGSRADALAEGWPRRMVDEVLRRIAGSQHKRRPPLVAKLSARTVGIDFRYPRDWGT